MKKIISLLTAFLLLVPLSLQTLAAAKAFTDRHEAGIYLREQMKERQDTVEISFSTAMTDDLFDGFDAYVSELHDDLFGTAFVHTGSGKEGDYLLRSYTQANTRVSLASDGETADITFTVSVTYKTDKEQEDEFDEAIAEILRSLVPEGTDRAGKVAAAHDFIRDRVEYDYQNLNDDSYLLKYSAYAALINKTAVCEGYAVLFYRFMCELGVPCRVITGTAGGGAHAWNIVEIGGVYYNVDVTWDDTTGTADWYLKGSDGFKDHVPDPEFLTAEFIAEHPISAADYRAGEDIPGEDVPGEDIPGEDVPGEDVPGEDIPGEDIPGEDTPGEDPPEETVLRGDADLDGEITSGDARLALRRAVGLEDYPEDSPAFRACDADSDGEVTPADARWILRFSVGLETVPA